MKQILIILGLDKDSTEEQAVAAITDIKASLDQAKQSIEALEKENADLLAANKDLTDQATKAITNETKVSEENADLRKAVNQLELDITELQKKGASAQLGVKSHQWLKDFAKKFMSEVGVAFIHVVSDGTPFHTHEDATSYAVSKGLDVHVFGTPPAKQ